MAQSLKSFVDSLPHRSQPLHEENSNRAIEARVDAVPDYVWPGLHSEAADDTDVSSSPVVLVTAPGAMGKSAAARAVAATTNGVYVDLAKMHVGSGTLTGELLKTLGAAAYEEFRSHLAAGKATLVLDSTDEAQLRAGADSFIEFVRDLAWQVSDGTSSSQVVLFGRSDSIDLTLLALEEVGLDAPVFTIAPLDHTASCAFIDLYLDRVTTEQGTTAVHRVHAEPFGRLRDQVLADLARALASSDISAATLSADWPVSADFLGYPPVLTAIAERLRVDNPSEELGRLENTGQSAERRRRGELLRGIVEYILDRESGKVRAAVGERLGMRDDDVTRSSLYGREEQVARLLSAVSVDGILVSHPAALNDADRVIYDDLVAGFIRDHPFLRGKQFASQVFSDYARAWAITSPVRGAWTPDETSFGATLPAVGPFYAHFLAALSLSDLPEAPEHQLSDILLSHRIGGRLTFGVIVERDGTGSVLLVDEDDPETLEFSVASLTGMLNLATPLTRLTVISDMGVTLRPGPTGKVELGPDVVIVCEELTISGNSLMATARDEQSGFTMLSAPAIRQDGALTVVSHPRNALLVYTEDPWHHWKPYVIEESLRHDRVSRNTMAQVVIAARRILTAFRPSSVDALTVSADKVDRLLVGRNEIYEASRDAMLQLGLIYRSGQVYELNLVRMGELGVSWTDLRGDDAAKALRNLCDAIIDTGLVK